MKKDNKTSLMDMEDEIKKLDELLNKEKIEHKAYLEKLYGRELEDDLKSFKKIERKKMPELPEFLKEKEEIPKNIHGPETDVSKYITRQQNKAKLFRKLDSLMSSPVAKGLGKAAKIGGGLLGLASEALATEDLGDAEISKDELAKLKAEKQMKPWEKELKQKLEENIKKPISLEEKTKNYLNVNQEKKRIHPFQVEPLRGVKEETSVGQLPKGKEDKRQARSDRFSKLQRHLMGKK